MTIKRFCRYKGIMCSLATEFGYCNLTACINRGVNHEAQVTLDDISTAYENGYKQGKFEALQWIPVSDHLPEKNGEYLVTVGKDSRFAFNGEATVYEDYFQFLCQWDDCGEDVVAWMPLPSPYKENES